MWVPGHPLYALATQVADGQREISTLLTSHLQQFPFPASRERASYNGPLLGQAASRIPRMVEGQEGSRENIVKNQLDSLILLATHCNIKSKSENPTVCFILCLPPLCIVMCVTLLSSHGGASLIRISGSFSLGIFY